MRGYHPRDVWGVHLFERRAQNGMLYQRLAVIRDWVVFRVARLPLSINAAAADAR